MRVFLFLFFCVLGAGCTSHQAAMGPPETAPGLVDGYYRVLRVVDGDTLILENVGRLRLANFDAPEPDEPGGEEMQERMIDLMTGELVWVRFRRSKAGEPVSGYYGRLLADVWVPWGVVAESR